ncbi:MAG: hotdog fold thioesterase [Pseudomonadales bacterium]|jgi:uncharacterized protein (TIGR00369 family)
MGEPGATLERRLQSSPFWRRVGFRLESASEGTVRVRLPYHEGNTTAATALHGGAIAATLDAAAMLASWSTIERDMESQIGRTLACDVSYLAGALGEDIFGEAEVLRRGREIVYSHARAVNGDGKLLAVANHIAQIAPTEPLPAAPTDPAAPDWPGARTSRGLGALPQPDAARVERNLEILRDLDGRMPYMAQLGWRFRSGSFGEVQFDLPCASHARDEADGIAGGALLSAVDHAGSLAAWMTSKLGSRGLFGSTVNTKLQTFTPLICRDCMVRARAAAGTGNLIHSEVSLVTAAGEPVAAGSTVYRIVERPRR